MFLYHVVPKGLRGGILYPLNALKDIYPEVYDMRARKYYGRKHLMRQVVPTLGCLWNDVLHFSPVDPKEIRSALTEAGGEADFSIDFYRIDPYLLKPERTTVYLYFEDRDELEGRDFSAYDPAAVEKYSVLPRVTKDYYKEMIGKGQWPLLYHRVPHILYRGALDITDTPIVTV